MSQLLIVRAIFGPISLVRPPLPPGRHDKVRVPGQMAADPSHFQNSLVLSVLTEPPAEARDPPRGAAPLRSQRVLLVSFPFPAWCKFDNKTPCYPTKGVVLQRALEAVKVNRIRTACRFGSTRDHCLGPGGLCLKPANEPPHFRDTCMVSAPQPVKEPAKAIARPKAGRCLGLGRD